MRAWIPDTGLETPAGRPGRRALGIALSLLFLLYAGCGLFGFGTDADSYLMLRSWVSLYWEHSYLPSRQPGYPLAELLIGFSSHLGGHILSNALSAAMGCAALACFYHLLRARFPAGTALWCAVALGLNPYWILAASSSMDYVYAAGFFLMGLAALRGRRPYLAALAFAAASASRLTYLPLGLLALGAMATLSSGLALRGRLAGAAALSLALTVLAYAPVYLALGTGMFTVHMDGPVSFFGTGGFASAGDYAARFAYKTVMLWGLPTFVVLLAAMIRSLRHRPADRDSSRVLIAAWAGFLYCCLVFLRIPVEVSYLLPTLFFGFFLMARFPRARAAAIAVLVFQLLQGVVALDFLRIEREAGGAFQKKTASGARLSPHFNRGVVLEDLSRRRARQDYFFPRAMGTRKPSEL
jgi:hypothetical protein